MLEGFMMRPGAGEKGVEGEEEHRKVENESALG